MIHHPNFSFPLRRMQAPLPHQQRQYTMPQKSIFTLQNPQPKATMSRISHHPRAASPSMTRRPSTLLSLLTTSWKTLNQEQLALETWTCKDPMCRTPHHQESPMDYCFIPNMSTPRDSKSCPMQSSPPGAVT